MLRIAVLCSALAPFVFLGTAARGATAGGERTEAAPADLPAPAVLTVTPSTINIRTADNMQHLVVTGSVKGGSALLDYTRKAVYASSNPDVAKVTVEGVVVPRGNGQAEIRATFGGQK